ncbi:MAG: sulfatase/phosphatase domain-containing protein, partial [Bacteroidota bacterium]
GAKSNHLEGGIRVPCIIKLPSVIPAGAKYNQPISTLDFLPTFLELAEGNADTLPYLDGVNLIPYLSGQRKSSPHEVLYWKKENRGTLRQGDWKLLRFPDRPAELYNLAEDIREENNLAAQHPEKVREMFKLLFAWEGELERPLWQLKRKYEVNAMQRMDDHRHSKPDE